MLCQRRVGMFDIRQLAMVIVTTMSLSACTTSLHGTFVTTSYVPPGTDNALEPLGPVTGKSCQTRILYLFPEGDAVSTDAAIKDAVGQYQGASYLTDIAIDDQTTWGFGYAVQCIIVNAVAY